MRPTLKRAIDAGERPLAEDVELMTHVESHCRFHERTLLEADTQTLHSSSKSYNPEVSR